MNKKDRAAIVLHAEAIIDATLAVQDTAPYESEQYALAEQIYDLANKLSDSVSDDML